MFFKTLMQGMFGNRLRSLRKRKHKISRKLFFYYYLKQKPDKSGENAKKIQYTVYSCFLMISLLNDPAGIT